MRHKAAAYDVVFYNDESSDVSTLPESKLFNAAPLTRRFAPRATRYACLSCSRMMGKKTRKGKLTNVPHGYCGRFYSLIRAKRADVETCEPGVFKNIPFHSSPVETSVAPGSCGLVQFWNNHSVDGSKKDSTEKRRNETMSQDEQRAKKTKNARNGKIVEALSNLQYYDYSLQYPPQQGQNTYALYQQDQQQGGQNLQQQQHREQVMIQMQKHDQVRCSE